MNREELYQLIEEGPVIMDGATGSNLQKLGMKPGICPERWILDHPDALIGLQERYVEAGSKILFAPTFTANRIKLDEYGLGESVLSINKELLSLSKKAAAGKAYVAGDMTMTGVALKPTGPMELEELIDIYKEQAICLAEAGCDLFVVETMMSLAEARAALIAIKEVSDLPVMVSMTYQEDGKTLYGTDPVTATVVLQSLGADVIGLNCSTGPEEMISLVKMMKEYADVPVMAKPNAGLPLLKDGETIYPMTAKEFASFGPKLVKAGAALIGGCCGTTPDHIRELSKSIEGMNVIPAKNRHPMVVASERKIQEISLDGRFLIIGERINPTGKKKLREELRAGSLNLVEEMAVSQEENGAAILDINMGTNGIDEKEMMLNAIERVSMVSNLPLCIDSSYVSVMEAALRAYPGRALINSISLEPEKINSLLPLVKKYGAMFILLPLSESGLPKDKEEKIGIIHRILHEADKLAISRKQIIVDGLVSTVGASKHAALDALETIRYCREELQLPTTVGLSNISFGLPERAYINAAFLAMAIGSGLSMAIANPSNELLKAISFASDLLCNKEEADVAYIGQVKKMSGGKDTSIDVKNEQAAGNHKENIVHEEDAVFRAVVKGNRKDIVSITKETLEKGCSAKEILDNMLIPAINEVGRLFDSQEYFLPQLIAGATAMEEAIHFLEPLLNDSDSREKKPVIVIATVEGDIHDIGKNLVSLMLGNYGYQMVDLGKDVPAEDIIEAAIKYKAEVICLSALMTTTMMRMKEVISLKNERGLYCKVIVGGAVITQSFADEIGADGYSADASEAVKLVDRLMYECYHDSKEGTQDEN